MEINLSNPVTVKETVTQDVEKHEGTLKQIRVDLLNNSTELVFDLGTGKPEYVTVQMHEEIIGGKGVSEPVNYVVRADIQTYVPEGTPETQKAALQAQAEAAYQDVFSEGASSIFTMFPEVE